MNSKHCECKQFVSVCCGPSNHNNFKNVSTDAPQFNENDMVTRDKLNIKKPEIKKKPAIKEIHKVVTIISPCQSSQDIRQSSTSDENIQVTRQTNNNVDSNFEALEEPIFKLQAVSLKMVENLAGSCDVICLYNKSNATQHNTVAQNVVVGQKVVCENALHVTNTNDNFYKNNAVEQLPLSCAIDISEGENTNRSNCIENTKECIIIFENRKWDVNDTVTHTVQVSLSSIFCFF